MSLANNGKGGRGRRGYFHSAKNSCSIYYQSSYELRAYIKLEEDSTVVSFGRCRFFVHYLLDGFVRRYTPDIMVEFVDGREVIIEVKSDWVLRHKEASRHLGLKLKVLREYCDSNGLDMELWTEEDL